MSDIKGKLVTSAKLSTWAEYGYGIFVLVNYVGPDELRNIRAKAVTRVWDSKTHRPIEDLDLEKFYELFAEAAIGGWRDVTGEKLRSMVLLSEYKDGEIEFTPAEGGALMRGCQSFDNFITYTSSELGIHLAAKKAAEVKNSQPSPAES